MGAPQGNQFWKLRAKHGRDRIFADPQSMDEAINEYFEATSERVWTKTDYRGKDADPVTLEFVVPFTMSGLCLFLGVSQDYFSEFKQSIKDKNDQTSKDFSGVIARMEQVMFTQKFEGASIGFFKDNIIARDLGLVDKKDLTSGGQAIIWNETKNYGSND